MTETEKLLLESLKTLVKALHGPLPDNDICKDGSWLDTANSSVQEAVSEAEEAISAVEVRS